jgi:hypothetical protein
MVSTLRFFILLSGVVVRDASAKIGVHFIPQQNERNSGKTLAWGEAAESWKTLSAAMRARRDRKLLFRPPVILTNETGPAGDPGTEIATTGGP